MEGKLLSIIKAHRRAIEYNSKVIDRDTKYHGQYITAKAQICLSLETAMKDSKYDERLKAIDWSEYKTAYGPADKPDSVASQLSLLAGSDHKTAMGAAHDLWCGLCHQHAYVSSAALPALPFILEVLDQANDDLSAEILDILLGFAVCSVDPVPVPQDFDYLHNSGGIRKKLRQHFQVFDNLLKSSVDEIKAVPGVSMETAKWVYELLHPTPQAPWMLKLRRCLQEELPRFRTLSTHDNEDISFFASQIIEKLENHQTINTVDIEIFVKYEGNKDAHQQIENKVKELFAKNNCISNGYSTKANLSPGEFTRLSVRASKHSADGIIEALKQAGLPKGCYAQRYDDADVPL